MMNTASGLVPVSLLPELEANGAAAERNRDATTTTLQRYRLFVPLLVLLTLLVAFWPLFDEPALPMDEGTLLVYPELVLQGQLPYRDFETFYGPANLWVLAGAYSLFEPSPFVERSVGLLYRVLSLLAIFGIAQRWGTTLAAGIMLIAGALLLPLQLGAFAWMGAMACGLIALWLAGRNPTRGSCFAAGLFASFALLFRPDVGPAVILAALPFLYRTPWRRSLHYLGGTAVGLVPLAFLTLATGPMQILNNFFIFPVLHCNPGRRLPLASVDASLLALFGLHLLACVVNLAAGWMAFRRDRNARDARLVLATALFSLGLTFQATQRLDHWHFFFVGFLSIALLPLGLVILARRTSVSHTSLVIPLLALVSVIALVEAISPELTIAVKRAYAAAVDDSPSRAVFMTHGDRTFPHLPGPGARAAISLFAQLEALSKPGERLFVGPADLRRTNCNDTFIYHMFPKLKPATYFLEMNPFSANRPNSRLAADLKSADWLVLNRRWDTWDEPNSSTQYGSNTPSEIVRDGFEICGEHGPYLLLRKKS